MGAHHLHIGENWGGEAWKIIDASTMGEKQIILKQFILQNKVMHLGWGLDYFPLNDPDDFTVNVFPN